MKNWIINLIVEFILKAISDEKVEEMAAQIKSKIIPFLREQKRELITRLEQKASATSTTIDNKVYHALDVFLDCFIPKETDAEKFASAALSPQPGNEAAIA